MRVVAAMNGTAAMSPALWCARFTPTVSMMMMSVGITQISTSPLINALVGSAFCSAPIHLGSSTVSRWM
jgi:hypothetical protein